MGVIRIILFIALAIAGAYFYFDQKELTHPPGITADYEPVQTAIKNPLAFPFGEYSITPLADFSVKARVLHRNRYYMDGGAKLVPVDLALGWQDMSDSRVLGQLDISQTARYYVWRTKGADYPIPREKISLQSANMHLIPANDIIKDRIKDAVAGDIVEFSGKLVSVTRPDGFHWSSSLTREDTGDGACELVFVDKFRIVK